VSHGALLAIRSNHGHTSNVLDLLRQSINAGRINPVVVADEDVKWVFQ
jgi:hypothetical protein